MKTLIVCHTYLNGNGGGVYASRAYINAIAKISDETTLVFPVNRNKYVEGIDKSIVLRPVDYNISPLVKMFVWMAGRCHFMKTEVKRCLELSRYDLIVFNSSLASGGLMESARRSGAKIITIHHNFEQEYCRDNRSGRFLLNGIHFRNVVESERRAVLGSDLNLTITDDDRRLLYKHYDMQGLSKIETLGCFETEDRKRIVVADNVTRCNFVITGSLSQIQTCNSLREWLEHYYKILKDECPEAIITIAGRNPNEQIVSMCKKLGINVVPNPVSMEPVLRDANFYICPICKGGGLKLRVMDGLSAGLPVLTHEVSARGYEVFKEKCLFAYHDEDSFRTSLRKMLSTEFNANDIQKIYYNSFSFSIGVKKLRKYIHSVL